jgi:hypothetical protein
MITPLLPVSGLSFALSLLSGKAGAGTSPVPASLTRCLLTIHWQFIAICLTGLYGVENGGDRYIAPTNSRIGTRRVIQ